VFATEWKPGGQLLASSRRSVSWDAARKTAREKNKKKRGERKRKNFLSFAFFLPFVSSCRAFLFFSRAVFRAAPLLAERLEEANQLLTHYMD